MKLFSTLLPAILFHLACFAKKKIFFFTTSDSVKLYIRIAGKGKSCLFVYGGSGSYYYEAMAGASIIEQKCR